MLGFVYHNTKEEFGMLLDFDDNEASVLFESGALTVSNDELQNIEDMKVLRYLNLTTNRKMG